MTGRQGHNAASNPGEVGFQTVTRPEPVTGIGPNRSRAATDMDRFADQQIHWLEQTKDRENPDPDVYNEMAAESYGYHMFQQGLAAGESVADAIQNLDARSESIADELVILAAESDQYVSRPLMKNVGWLDGQDEAFGRAVVGLRYAVDRLNEQAKERGFIERLTVESVTAKYGNPVNGVPLSVARELAKDIGQPVLIENRGSRYTGNQLAGASIARFQYAMPGGSIRTSEVVYNVYAADGSTPTAPRYEAHKVIRFGDHTVEHQPTALDLVEPRGHTQYEGTVGDVFTNREDAWAFIDKAAKTTTSDDAHPSRHKSTI